MPRWSESDLRMNIVKTPAGGPDHGQFDLQLLLIRSRPSQDFVEMHAVTWQHKIRSTSAEHRNQSVKTDHVAVGKGPPSVGTDTTRFSLGPGTPICGYRRTSGEQVAIGVRFAP